MKFIIVDYINTQALHSRCCDYVCWLSRFTEIMMKGGNRQHVQSCTGIILFSKRILQTISKFRIAQSNQTSLYYSNNKTESSFVFIFVDFSEILFFVIELVAYVHVN